MQKQQQPLQKQHKQQLQGEQLQLKQQQQENLMQQLQPYWGPQQQQQQEQHQKQLQQQSEMDVCCRNKGGSRSGSVWMVTSPCLPALFTIV
jgi:hypothetical protein